MSNLYNKLSHIYDSAVEFPKIDLASSVWYKIDNVYDIKPEVVQIIAEYMRTYEEFDIIGLIKKIHIVGSITTNLYNDTTDIDVHIIPNETIEKVDDAEDLVNRVKSWSHTNPVYIDKHPIELYIQLNEQQDLMSDGVYDLMNREWVKGPLLYPLTYNPFTTFNNVLDDVAKLAGEADINIGELKRDIIDYKIIKNAIIQMPYEYKQKLINNLKTKLEEIELDIDKLSDNKDAWFKMRRESSMSLSNYIEDMNIARNFKDKNAIFKFIDRYQYIKIIKELENLLNDGELSDDDINNIEKIIRGDYE